MTGTSTEDVLRRNTRVSKPRRTPGQDLPSSVILFEGAPLTVDKIHLMSMEKREIVAQFLFKHFRETGFPYPRYPEEDLHKDWSALKALNTKDLWTKNDTVVSSGATSGNKLFKHFFPHFWECTETAGSKLKPSMVDQFEDDAVLLSVIRNRLGITFVYRGVHFPFNISGDMLRQGMRSMHMAPMTTNFRPSVAKALYARFLPSGGTAYDFSVGFGQRMLGFLADGRGATYIGVDPWEKQVRACKTLAAFIGAEDKVDVQVGQSETFCPDVHHGQVDLAFSSPPYFSTEVYDTAREGQAYACRTYAQFLSSYWTPTVANVHKLLRDGGRMVVNVSETSKRNPLKRDVVDICTKAGFRLELELSMSLTKSHLTGKVGTGNNTKTEPILVFRKF